MPLSNSGAVLGDAEGAQGLPLQDPAVLPYAQQSVLLIQKQGTVPLVGAEAVCGLERRLQSLIFPKRGGVRLNSVKGRSLTRSQTGQFSLLSLNAPIMALLFLST